MENELLDLMSAAIEKRPTDFQETLSAMLYNRAAVALEERKIELAKGLYGGDGLEEETDSDDLDIDFDDLDLDLDDLEESFDEEDLEELDEEDDEDFDIADSDLKDLDEEDIEDLSEEEDQEDDED